MLVKNVNMGDRLVNV